MKLFKFHDVEGQRIAVVIASTADAARGLLLKKAPTEADMTWIMDLAPIEFPLDQATIVTWFM